MKNEPRHYTCLRSASQRLLEALRANHGPLVAYLVQQQVREHNYG